MTLELNARAMEIIEKVKKLLAIAADDSAVNEHQAASAAAKAQELLEAYNLDMAQIDDNRTSDRQDKKRKGGLYKWQRSLWDSVAKLNFCMYWSEKGNYKGAKYEHRVLGRQENVIGAEILADYLQQTIERIAQDTARERELNVFCKPMIAFREGMAERLCERLLALRREKLAAEKEQQAKDQAQQANGDTTNALVLATLIADEESLNYDHLYGFEPGTTARRRQKAQEGYKRSMADREQWKLDNPVAYAAEREASRKADEAYWKKEERNARRRKGYRPRAESAEDRRRGMAEFGEGYSAGGDVSLNQQLNDNTTTQID